MTFQHYQHTSSKQLGETCDYQIYYNHPTQHFSSLQFHKFYDDKDSDTKHLNYTKSLRFTALNQLQSDVT
ncbi:hypothetical protein TRIATDRAFT_255449 [Trichoderma atroviride IMI 206040]|uniref:Uncharacterized protein n=1 Tax=Hypocrea atroviridis (strain ATCC 20476 / IMI 206040) TaxID=452589 RepID=G9NLM4_HYPAI|nr:uncharacterized protein TRIATDRAFT_255449 [Trichoderma atroviride IMI 206040]EHK48786.1 hypothetical protein TRIATDRAFT_255449 [Trichoderma atroviride IMI 206040]